MNKNQKFKCRISKFRLHQISMFILLVVLTSLSSKILAQSNVKELSGEDYIEILQLYSKYPLTLDSGDGEAFADLFTEDGAFGTIAVGREALIAFANRGAGSARRHAPLVPMIIPTEEGAMGVVTNLFLDMSQNPPVVSGVSQYTDIIVKTPDGWRFKSRNNGTADLRDENATTIQSLMK